MQNRSRSSKGRRFISLGILLSGLSFGAATSYAAGPCHGRFPNLLTDICWRCIFPINIGPAPITAGYQGMDPSPPPPIVCECPAPPPIFVRFGLGVSFWEPARAAEVVRTPFCSPLLNGTTFASMIGPPAGTNHTEDGLAGDAFYHAHWLTFPVLSWIGLAAQFAACIKGETLDVGYMTELDPLWDDDELAFLLNPEVALFANPIAQLACAPDTLAAAVTFFGIDVLFWCGGSQGSVYPLDGSHANHIGAVDSSLAIVHKLTYKMHRQLLAHDTSTFAALCGNVPQPVLRKGQYKQQMLFPVPYTLNAFGFGTPSSIWGAGREFPISGEDFAYLVWRKKICCAL